MTPAVLNVTRRLCSVATPYSRIHAPCSIASKAWINREASRGRFASNILLAFLRSLRCRAQASACDLISRCHLPSTLVCRRFGFVVGGFQQQTSTSVGGFLRFLLMVRFDKGKANPLPIGSVVFVENGLAEFRAFAHHFDFLRRSGRSIRPDEHGLCHVVVDWGVAVSQDILESVAGHSYRFRGGGGDVGMLLVFLFLARLAQIVINCLTHFFAITISVRQSCLSSGSTPHHSA